MILTTKSVFCFSSTQLDGYARTATWQYLFFYLVNNTSFYFLFPVTISILDTYMAKLSPAPFIRFPVF